MNIYIIDHTEKRRGDFGASIQEIFRDNSYAKIEIHEEPYVKENGIFIEIKMPCIVFLHLGDGRDCGNVDSLQFYIERLKNNKIPVIAYSGGTKEKCPKPSEFNEYVEDQKWHCYHNLISGPGSLNLDNFFREWSNRISEDIKGAPPLDKLISNYLSHLAALCILCQGYLAAHDDSSLPGWTNLEPDLQKKIILKKDQTEELAWWNVFGSINLCEKIQEEWGNTLVKESPLYKLASILQEKEKITELSLVKNAYMEISGKLRSSK